MRKITQAQYRKARKILEQSAKESKNHWANLIKPIIKKYANTYWSKTDSFQTKSYFNIQPIDSRFVITSLAHYVNGKLEIKRHWISPTKIDEFLGSMVERNDHEDYDENRDLCDCPQLEQTHYYEQHNPLKQITKRVFETQVQKHILNEFSLGLKFTKLN